jgi:hypothetical protein
MSARLPPEVKAANKIKFGKIRSERMIGEGNHFYGKQHSQDTIEKNRAAHIGKPSSRLGAKHTEETKHKIRDARFGKPKVPRSVSQPADSAIRYIPLTKGKVAIVDAEDYECINSFLWISHHDKNIDYAQRALPKEKGIQKDQKMHHVIMGYPPEGLMIDHINGNGLDNRKSNLRFVTNRQNCMNRHQNTTSRYPGVTWNKRAGKWNAQAQVFGKHKHIGTFRKEEDAYQAYLKVVHPLEESIKERLT